MSIDLKRMDMGKAMKLLAKAKAKGKKIDKDHLEVDEEFAEEFNTFFDGLKEFNKDLAAENERLKGQIKGDYTVMQAKTKQTGAKWKNKFKNLFKKSKEKQSDADAGTDTQ